MKTLEREKKTKLESLVGYALVFAVGFTVLVVLLLLFGQYVPVGGPFEDMRLLLQSRGGVPRQVVTADENIAQVQDTAAEETAENEASFWDKLFTYGPAAITVIDTGFTFAGIIVGLVWLLWWIEKLGKLGAVPGGIFFALSIIAIRGWWGMLEAGDIIPFVITAGIVAYGMIADVGFIGIALMFSGILLMWVWYIAYQRTWHLFNVLSWFGVEDWVEFLNLWGIDYVGERAPGPTAH